jgi:hypothetical protein
MGDTGNRQGSGAEIASLDAVYGRTYIAAVHFEWDPKKAEANLQKHGVDFADAVGVLYDEMAVTIEDEGATEERYITLGRDPLNRVLVVVYTWRGDTIRIISARKAEPRERRQYEAQL